MTVPKGYDAETGGRALERRLGLAALAVLVISFSTLAYTFVSVLGATDIIEVNGVEYSWDEIEIEFNVTEIDGRSGYLLSDIINSTGLVDPASHEYAIIGADGYRKTVGWTDMENGLLIVQGKEVYFSTRPKQFNVHEVVEIEVV